MADVLLSSLPEETQPTSDAIVYVMDDPSGSAADRKVKISNIQKVSGGRELLTANRTYYVRTDGSDSNDGLQNSAGRAFLTIQKAVNVISTTLNLGGYDVTIQLGDGSYAEQVLVNSPWDGVGTVTITGNASTPADVIVGTSTINDYAFKVSNSARLLVNNLKVTGNTAYSYGLWAEHNGYIGFSNIVFASYVHIYASNSGNVECNGNYTIASGTYGCHFMADNLGKIRIFSITVTVSGTPAFNISFAYIDTNAILYCVSNTFSGSATGVRYYALLGGKINTSSGSETALPGNTAGIMDSWGSMAGMVTAYNRKFLLTASEQSVTSSTTLVTTEGGAGLVASMTAGHIYKFTAKLFTSSGTSGGIKVSFNGDGTATYVTYEGLIHSGGTITQAHGATLNATIGVTAVSAAYVEIHGTISVATTGNFGVWFAQNASDGTATKILVGSTLEVIRWQ